MTETRKFGLPPSAEDLVDMAEHALSAIPARLAAHVQGIGIVVEDMPDDETLDDMEIESPWDLTGLYRGRPMTQRGVGDIVTEPDMIFLFREPILLEWVESGVDLYHLVRNVLIHEIAHHFGFSDADIEALEKEMDA